MTLKNSSELLPLEKGERLSYINKIPCEVNIKGI